jgi:hypothetical protein
MPRKTLKQRRNPTDDNENRVRGLVDEMIGGDNKQSIMQRIQETLSGSSPSDIASGSIFTFVYNAKTPGLFYDPHPLVIVRQVFPWGFVGRNLHWGKGPEADRYYTWSEIVSPVYEIRPEEQEDMIRLNYGDFSETPSK